MESDYTSLAIKVLEGVGGGINGGFGARGAAGGDTSVGVEEFDWLNEGLEGEEFTDDIFGESSPHNVPLEPMIGAVD